MNRRAVTATNYIQVRPIMKCKGVDGKLNCESGASSGEECKTARMKVEIQLNNSEVECIE